MNASEFARQCKYPVFFYAGNGAPAGQSIAIWEDTELPVDLDDVTGVVNADEIFEADDLVSGPTAYDWKVSDFNGNIIYKIQVFDDEATWTQQREEWEAGA